MEASEVPAPLSHIGSLANLAAALSLECSRYGIRAVCVAPGNGSATTGKLELARKLGPVR